MSVVSWNLGYAALGSDADFVADGGTSLRASSQHRIETNLTSISSWLSTSHSEVHLLQEVAAGGFMTRGVDVREGVSTALQSDWVATSSEIKTRFLPRLISMDHGMLAASSVRVESARTVEITREPERIGGLLIRAYHVQIVRLFGPAQWSLINVHLSAYDDGAERTAQLSDVLALAQVEYEAGRRVIVGGDFNQRLVQTDFAYTSAEEAQFWLRDFPDDALPEGWKIAADETTPTVRTLERTFAPGENYTAVIDGFIVSPNVEIVSVRGVDTGFEHTDHQPVILNVRARLE